MDFTPFFNLFHYEKTQAVEKIIQGATPRNEFYLMNSIAAIVAVAGLFENNMPLILGSMLIAPLLYPLFAMSMGVVARDWQLLLRSLRTIFISSILGILLATLTATFMFKTGNAFPSEGYLETIQPTKLLLIVSFLSGIAAATAVTNKQLNSVLPGIAISVALIPPLAATGIHLAYGTYPQAFYTGLLYLGSLLFVFLACTIVFYQMEFQTQHRQAEKELKSEEKKQENRAKQ